MCVCLCKHLLVVFSQPWAPSKCHIVLSSSLFLTHTLPENNVSVYFVFSFFPVLYKSKKILTSLLLSPAADAVPERKDGDQVKLLL